MRKHCNYGVQCGSRSGGEMLSAMSPIAVLFLMSVLCNVSPARATNLLGPCAELKEKWGINNTEKSKFMRSMSVNGEPNKIQLRGGGAARAAHELLHVLLRHLLRYTNCSVEHIKTEEGFYELIKGRNNIATVSAALAWREQSAEAGQYEERAAIGANALSLIGAGVAPVERRLFLHAATKEPAHCHDPTDWTVITDQSCGYLSPPETQPLPSGWPNCTCSPPDLCVPVLVVQHEGVNEAALLQLLVSLCSRVAAVPSRPALQLVSSNQKLLLDKLKDNSSSFLYIDYYYDNLFGKRHAPFLPNTNRDCPATLENAVSLFMVNRNLLYYFAPRVQSLLHHFKPSQRLLQDISRNAIGMNWEESACKVATDNLNDIRPWLEPEPDIEKVKIMFYSCQKHLPALHVANTYWENSNVSNGNVSFRVTCSTLDTRNKIEEVVDDIDTISRLPEWRRLGGFVVMLEEGTEKLPKQTRQLQVPVMLVQARGEASDGVQAVLPATLPLVEALRWLLASCKWNRVAILREESRSDFWNLFSVENRTGPEKIHEQTFNAAQSDEALVKLVARNARVIVVDARAAATKTVLLAALSQNLTPANGYAWIVLGSAGDDDWLPLEDFSYVTISSWWRGGISAKNMTGSEQLRDQLDKNPNVTYSPQTASYIDALLLLNTGISKYLEANPNYLYDLHAPDFARSMFALLENTSIAGVAQTYGRDAEQLVFVHRWTRGGGRLVGMYQKNAPENTTMCENVKDAPTCHTMTFGHDSFSPQCHDVAIAVILCIMALTPPALCGAAAARRARLRRRDRALEERLLARSGHTVAAAAAATAALAAHAVPRSSLEILDELGFGHYGSVRLAILRAPGSAPLAVAAKSPREDAPAEAEEELLREAALLATLKHEHIVRFAGVCFEGAPLVLMENAFHGDLRRYLRAHRPLAERARVGLAEPEAERVGAPELTRLAREAAAALSYLKDCRLVHRDVRAANCLVDVRRTLKLADFGMARRLDEAGEQGAEYMSRRRGMFPVLWMAPESLTRGVFSAASDVWGLGVLLLELAMLGARPYGAWPAPRVLRHVLAGGAPPLPRDAAPSTRGLLAACWCRAPEMRPSAASLVDYLARHPRVLQPALAHADSGSEGPEPITPEEKLNFDDWN